MSLEESSAPDVGLSPEGNPGQDRQRSVKAKKKWEKDTAEANVEDMAKKPGEKEELLGIETQIESLTKAGHRALIRHRAKQSLSCFKRALSLSEETLDGQAQRICAFNLGAAYVEAGKPGKGLPFLLRAQPTEGEGPEHLGDLFFNIGAARQGLGDFVGALESFRKARGHYRSVRAGSEAGTYVEMGCCYLGMQDTCRAVHCFLEAGRAYEEGGNFEPAAMVISQAAGLMCQDGGHGAGETADVLHACRRLCGRISNRDLLGKLYHEIGLCFSQIKIFSLAAESFEEALLHLGRNEESATEDPRGKEAAALLQNLGAAQNALGNFPSAVGFHLRAASLHGSLGNRRAQGQCFCNMAFAFSQLGDHEAAGENYLHALQAFKDAGDLQGQWQVCEGLGASRFHAGDPGKAILHYKEALSLISKCQDVPDTIQERIVHQLTDALRSKLSRNGRPFPSPEILPSDPTRMPGSHPASHVRFTTPLRRTRGRFPPVSGQASEWIGADPAGCPGRNLEPHQPGWRGRLRSITCTLM